MSSWSSVACKKHLLVPPLCHLWVRCRVPQWLPQDLRLSWLSHTQSLPWGLLTKWPPAGEQGTTWQGEELMGHRKCDSQRTERSLCFKLLIPAFCREKSSVNDLNTALLVLISFEWREKMPHLKIITALCFMILLGWGSGTSTSCMRCLTLQQKWSYRRWLYFGQLALLEPGFRSHLVLVD